MSDLVTGLLQRIAQDGNVTDKNRDDAPRRMRICAPVVTMILVALVSIWFLVPRGGDPRARTYFAAEREAREARRGLSAGSFDRPEEWRRKPAGTK
jgi:endonuclease YncB( thermonuclease family)